MLESAITKVCVYISGSKTSCAVKESYTHPLAGYTPPAQNSGSVTLDLLTYSDLEALRDSKSSSISRKQTSPHNISSGSTVDNTHTKRYLILTYSAAFDR